ncbi:hypothetical protein DFH11DRAFT_1234579 [Phellopilus nigrolimitatus]|nr:hypothetical protein DFH11DRAFT_1234579 [Phellopilus nigrolimitatus]
MAARTGEKSSRRMLSWRVTHARACAPVDTCRDARRRGRRECGSSAELVCSRRRERVESPVQVTSGALALPAPSIVPPSPYDAPTPSSQCEGAGPVPRRGCTTFAAASHVSQQIPARTPGVLQAVPVSIWRQRRVARARRKHLPWLLERGLAQAGEEARGLGTGFTTANAHSAVTASADLKKDGYHGSSSPARRARSLPRTRRIAPPMLSQLPFDFPSLSPPQHVRAHAASPPYTHIHESHPLPVHPAFSFSLPFISRICACTYGSVQSVLLRSEFSFCLAGCQAALRVGSSFGWANIKVVPCTLRAL